MCPCNYYEDVWSSDDMVAPELRKNDGCECGHSKKAHYNYSDALSRPDRSMLCCSRTDCDCETYRTAPKLYPNPMCVNCGHDLMQHDAQLLGTRGQVCNAKVKVPDRYDYKPDLFATCSCWNFVEGPNRRAAVLHTRRKSA